MTVMMQQEDTPRRQAEGWCVVNGDMLDPDKTVPMEERTVMEIPSMVMQNFLLRAGALVDQMRKELSEEARRTPDPRVCAAAEREEASLPNYISGTPHPRPAAYVQEHMGTIRQVHAKGCPRNGEGPRVFEPCGCVEDLAREVAHSYIQVLHTERIEPDARISGIMGDVLTPTGPDDTQDLRAWAMSEDGPMPETGALTDWSLVDRVMAVGVDAHPSVLVICSRLVELDPNRRSDEQTLEKLQYWNSRVEALTPQGREMLDRLLQDDSENYTSATPERYETLVDTVQHLR